MIDTICQIAIVLFCMSSIFIVNDPRPRVSRWGCLFGLMSEPFWFYTTYTHSQWGIFAASFVYAFSWARGVYHQWIRKPT